MATDQLKLYNGALRLCKERRLGSLSEPREPRRLLDDAWNNEAREHCLEQGLWNFAMRAVQLDYVASIEPSFGFRRAFTKPDDYVRLAGISVDGHMHVPLLQYTEEGGYWLADLDVIYVKYVSKSVAHGLDMSLWPTSFTRFVEAYLALQIVGKLTTDAGRTKEVQGMFKHWRKEARSTDAMAEPTSFPPTGNWVRARGGQGSGGGRRQDGGGSGSLIG